jgi:hypothetical protein
LFVLERQIGSAFFDLRGETVRPRRLISFGKSFLTVEFREDKNMKFYRRAWLPLMLPELSVWFINFTLKLTEFADELGVSAETLKDVGDDRDTVKWLADAQAADAANSAGLRGFRDNTLYGEKNDAEPVAPVYVLPPPPAPLTKRVIERLLELVDDIQDAAAYSPEIGAQLGIVVPQGERLAPEDWTTEIKGKALPEMQLEIDFVRGEADGINLQFQYVGEETWQNGGNYPKRPAVITIAPKAPNAAQAVRIRGRLLKGNSPVGNYSDTINLVAAP